MAKIIGGLVIVLLLSMFVISCTGSDLPTQYGLVQRHIINCAVPESVANWQERELACRAEGRCINPGVTELQEIAWLAQGMLDHKKDDVDYTQTSCEANESQKGDCEDFGALAYRLLSEAGYPESKIGMVLLVDFGNHDPVTGSYFGHTVPVVYIDDFDFWILDNGFLTFVVSRASEFLESSRLSLYCGYNLTEYWIY
ncbi:MAG: transglutaminase-like cysteine peptidase [Deltaproteobacteria bacterium]|nr:MAG: transglutaminase-like cysteine peptidase [Deltaproteobacteria bacterium]